LPIHIRVRTVWNTEVPLSYPVHLPGKVGHGGVHRAGGDALVALLVHPMLAQDSSSGLVHILLFFRLPHIPLRLKELLTKDLPGLQHLTLRLELLLALISRKNLDRLRSWSCHKDRHRYWSWDCGQNRY